MMVLESPQLSETITMRRATGVVNAYGEYAEDVLVETTIQAVVEPLGDDRLPQGGGLQRETRWRVFTRAHLQALAQDSRGDELEIRGRWHRVVLVSYHSGPRAPHYEAETVLAS